MSALANICFQCRFLLQLLTSGRQLFNQYYISSWQWTVWGDSNKAESKQTGALSLNDRCCVPFAAPKTMSVATTSKSPRSISCQAAHRVDRSETRTHSRLHFHPKCSKDKEIKTHVLLFGQAVNTSQFPPKISKNKRQTHLPILHHAVSFFAFKRKHI